MSLLILLTLAPPAVALLWPHAEETTRCADVTPRPAPPNRREASCSTTASAKSVRGVVRLAVMLRPTKSRLSCSLLGAQVIKQNDVEIGVVLVHGAPVILDEIA